VTTIADLAGMVLTDASPEALAKAATWLQSVMA
jgi:hypothetical protein